MYYVYVLESQKDNRFYTGFTSNLETRLQAHNRGKVRSTRSRRPFILLYSEELETKEMARERELYLKSGIGREFMKRKLSQNI